MKNMKKWMLCIILLLCMAGCEKKEVQTGGGTNVTEEDLTLIYEGTETNEIWNKTVDENGVLYVASYDWQEAALCISVYDSNGICLEKKLLGASSGSVKVLESGNGVLYLVVPESGCSNVLYEINTTTWEARRVYDFYEFQQVEQVVQMGEELYVFGELKNPPLKQYSQYSRDRNYTYSGETVVKLSPAEAVPTLEEVAIDFPISIFAVSEDVLGVYCYTEENGFVLCEYKQGELEQKRQLMEASYSKFRSCGEGFLYVKSEGRVCYGTMDEEAETELLVSSEWGGFGDLWMCYQNGFFYSTKRGQAIKRVPMDTILKENKTLQFLSSSWIDEWDVPSGCGYQMNKLVLDAEAFALKVLAQDTDFDLYLLSSRESTSYNLKKNGAFYPLNEVEGVQEYLDACFPYVKETATNEEGDIWMLPVALEIPGLVINKKFCEKNGVDFTQMNMAEFMDLTAEAREVDTDYVGMSSLVFREVLFGQYMSKYDTFDNALFREFATKFKETKAKNWSNTFQVGGDARNIIANGKTNIPDFYYSSIIYRSNMEPYFGALGKSTLLGVVPVPTIEKDIPNVGTMTFMMVNPQSENLEDTLQYISAYAKYALKKENSFILADESTYMDTPFAKDCYALYANGGIYFEMEDEIYLDTFTEYINGEIELEEMITEIERRRKVYLGE